MEIAICKITIANLKEIVCLHNRVFKLTYSEVLPEEFLQGISFESTYNYWSKLVESECYLRMAKFGDRLVGFIAGGICRGMLISDKGEVYSLYVDPEFQKERIGTMLLCDLFKHLSWIDLQHVVVTVIAGSPSIGFYSRTGGKELRRQTRVYGYKEIEEVVFEYNLTESLLL